MHEALVRKIGRLMKAGLGVAALATAARLPPLEVLAVLADEPVADRTITKLTRVVARYAAVQP